MTFRFSGFRAVVHAKFHGSVVHELSWSQKKTLTKTILAIATADSKNEIYTTGHKTCHQMFVNIFTKYCLILADSRTLLNLKVKVNVIFFVSGPKFTKLFLLNVGKIVVDNAIYDVSIALSVREIFTIEVKTCPKI